MNLNLYKKFRINRLHGLSLTVLPPETRKEGRTPELMRLGVSKTIFGVAVDLGVFALAENGSASKVGAANRGAFAGWLYKKNEGVNPSANDVIKSIENQKDFIVDSAQRKFGGRANDEACTQGTTKTTRNGRWVEEPVVDSSEERDLISDPAYNMIKGNISHDLVESHIFDDLVGINIFDD